MTIWIPLMLVGSGLFAAGTVIAAARMPLWRRMPIADFKPDFARTIVVADKLQPALLLLALTATVGFSLRVDAMPRAVALISAAGLIVILVASGAVLVPLQRRIIRSDDRAEVSEALRKKWLRGHLGRCALAVSSFMLVVLAASL
jgi:hypothetical protein